MCKFYKFGRQISRHSRTRPQLGRPPPGGPQAASDAVIHSARIRPEKLLLRPFASVLSGIITRSTEGCTGPPPARAKVRARSQSPGGGRACDHDGPGRGRCCPGGSSCRVIGPLARWPGKRMQVTSRKASGSAPAQARDGGGGGRRRRRRARRPPMPQRLPPA